VNQITSSTKIESANGLESKPNRIEWVDTVRGIAFLMVIYAHLDYRSSALMHCFSPLVLTLFFFASGYLFKSNQSVIQALEQRVRTLLVPFLLLGIFDIGLSYVISFSNSHNSLYNESKNFLLQVYGHEALLWFVACLFACSIPFYFCAKYIRSVTALLIFVSCVFCFSALIKIPVLPWHIQFIPFGLFYMSLGLLYKRTESKFGFIDHPWAISLSFLTFGSIVAIEQFAFHKAIGTITPTTNVIDGIICTVAGIGGCVGISKRIGRKIPLLSFVGANSLLYFGLHGKCYAVLQIVTKHLFQEFSIASTPLLNLILGIAIVFLDVVCLIAPIMLINKYVGFITGKGYKIPIFFFNRSGNDSK